MNKKRRDSSSSTSSSSSSDSSHKKKCKKHGKSDLVKTGYSCMSPFNVVWPLLERQLFLPSSENRSGISFTKQHNPVLFVGQNAIVLISSLDSLQKGKNDEWGRTTLPFL